MLVREVPSAFEAYWSEWSVFDLVWCVVNAFDHSAHVQLHSGLPRFPDIMFVDLIEILPRGLTGRKGPGSCIRRRNVA